MEGTAKVRPSSSKKFRSPVGGKRPHKSSVFPKFRLNLKEPDKQGQKGKQKTGKTGSKHHFRLGGDSTDPLNLNSLIDRDPSEVTPQCSPYVDRGKETSPCVFVQPQDVKDPLNLKCDLYQDLKGIVVVTPTRKKRKRKRNDSGCFEEEREDKETGNFSKKESDLAPKVRRRKKNNQKVKDKKDVKSKEKKTTGQENDMEKEDKSGKSAEVIPKEKNLPQMSKDVDQKREKLEKEETSTGRENSSEKVPKEATPASLPKDSSKREPPAKSFQKSASSRTKCKKTFVYGNYNRYYGYRNQNLPGDPRLKLFRKDWFRDKDVLDIGCNIGNVTMEVARDFGPKHVLGIDIDSALIRAANKNMRFAVQEHLSKKSSDFPVSFLLCRGPVVSSGCSAEEKNAFPYNVEFKEENFVLPNDSALAKQKPTYDVILCLSLTKWIHLNWGDEGLKRAFKRMFLMLRPGGRLLLEAQPFTSYSRRKNLSEKIRRNYDSIQFKPNQFVDFLMSEEVGFASYEALGISENTSKGFQRPLYLFTKGVSGECYDALGVDISGNLRNTSASSHCYFD